MRANGNGERETLRYRQAQAQGQSAKSAVDRASKRSFWASASPRASGPGETSHPRPSGASSNVSGHSPVGIEVSASSGGVEELSRYLTGWNQYFGYCERPSTLRHLDSWVRRRLRCAVWKQWKRGRRRFAELRLRDVGKTSLLVRRAAPTVPGGSAAARPSSYAFPIHVFDSLGLPRLYPRPRAQPR